VIWRILDSPDQDRDFDQAAFDRAKASVPDMERKAYADRFYALRSGEQDADPEAWAILLPPFEGLPEAVRGLAARFRMAIATSKDLRSVRLLLFRYGIEDCFAKDMILDKNFSYSKRDHLDHFRRTFSIPFGRMHFVDDKLLHLTAVRDMGVRCYLAGWGFNTERERREAREAGFGVLSMRGFEALEP
jgi:phosphoglycolate phosphatase-like HAD superfamily hydrolase